MNRCEAEIDAIRLKLYEETKDLTREEQMMRSMENAHKLAAQYGFKIVASAKADKRKAI
jgi:hypothetical protein